MSLAMSVLDTQEHVEVQLAELESYRTELNMLYTQKELKPIKKKL